ncbi:hypothetical protein AM493_20295 [Flavobacterium akiainvivens]|uniref:Knr4/Smi1-like domain-containing protein n=1 Tax=Flavobacterium akiainvivens TaxID=1202724 RepID=A0A0M9VJT9_9FLAO|nr:hypothetical protein [Flavobacterium akiainvivens]KOS08126.1 hypothetical protein AM493_20295 [Flavobacterium akiainvivens]SFQ72123.1 hypothetical protein SAMN05444144_11767 [Flavobacterium akiainvivens]
MEIKHLNKLQENPTDGYSFNSPIPESEITELEVLFNDGKIFPHALRELMYLAGNFCYVLDYGIEDTPKKMQEFVREELKDTNQNINRPFYAIDTYNGNDQFLFIYLDEGNDPPVYQAQYYVENLGIYPITNSLSSYINDLIQRVKQGRNPF